MAADAVGYRVAGGNPLEDVTQDGGEALVLGVATDGVERLGDGDA